MNELALDWVRSGDKHVMMRRLGELQTVVLMELKDVAILILPRDLVPYYDEPLRDWNLPEAATQQEIVQEIKEASTALALGRPTASVFHSMRIAERGLRLLARHLRVKLGAGRHIEHEDWGTVLKAINKKLDALRAGMRSPQRSMALQMYSDLADQCSYFNGLWRTEVSHARRMYNTPAAVNALTRVRDFMQRLTQVGTRK